MRDVRGGFGGSRSGWRTGAFAWGDGCACGAASGGGFFAAGECPIRCWGECGTGDHRAVVSWLEHACCGAGSGRGGLQGDRHADGGHDPLRPSSNVDYLLEDVEEPRSWGKFILVVAALALALGFGYLHWKRGGFDWLNAGEKKPTAATKQAPEAGPSNADSGGATAAPAVAAPQAGAGTATASGAASPAESGAGQTSPAQTSPQDTPAQSAPAPSAPAQAAAPQNTEQTTPQSNAGDSGALASQAGDTDSDKQPVAAEPNAGRRAAARKPAAAKPAAAKPVDSVTEAERYIYGRGVRPDCERGLGLLKPAAGQSNVKAMISLGALYSTGTCTPRDLPTAYRWFALALHKEPDNQALQNDLQKLWSQMTQPERQLAIKLSQ